jgi:hypothetical protein
MSGTASAPSLAQDDTSPRSPLTLFLVPLTFLFRLRVYREPGPEVIPQNHAHVDSPERVGLDHHLPCSERLGHIVRSGGIAPAHDDPGGIGDGIGVAEEHHIQPLTTEHSGGGSGRALPAGSVQYLHRDPAFGCGYREGMGRVLLPLGGAKQESDPPDQKNEPAD